MRITTRFGLNEKLIAITTSTILIVLSSYVYFNLKTFIHIYKESVIKMVFAQAQELKTMVYDVTELGLALGELKGVNEECEKMVENISYATYCFVMDNAGRVYYHNLPEKVGYVYTDSITQNAIKTKKDLVQYIHLDSQKDIYDFSIPLKSMSGEKIGTIRIGIVSSIVDNVVRKQKERALILGVLSILISFLIVSILYRLSILKPIRSLMNGITGFGEGKFDTRVALQTKDEFGELAKTFNRMADELQKTTDSLRKEIVERKKAEEGLKEKDRVIESIIQNSAVATFVIDSNHKVIYWNMACEELTGVKARDLIGTGNHWKAFYDHSHPCLVDLVIDNKSSDMAEFYKVYARSLLIRNGLHAEGWYPKLGGKNRYILFDAAPIYDINGELIAAIETLQEITDRKKAEEERERLIGELAEGQRLLKIQKQEAEDSRSAIKSVADDLMKSKEILEYQKGSLEDINKELDDFTYIVSHDLKEPLRSIDAYSKFIVDDYRDKLGEEGKHYLERIRANAERMKRLIEDLLEISRLKNKGSTIEEVETGELIGEAKMRLEYAIKQKGMEIIIKDKLPKIFCDRVRLSEVFLNLISNAIKFNDKPKPMIEIGYNDKGDLHEFYVRDNGIGIEKEYFDKVFEIFQRLGKREDVEGTGAGLTIVKKIIQLHKGKIWIESKIGEGSTFYFTIPKEKSIILGKKLIGEILVEAQLVTEEQIKKALEEQGRITGRINKGGQDGGNTQNHQDTIG